MGSTTQGYHEAETLMKRENKTSNQLKYCVGALALFGTGRSAKNQHANNTPGAAPHSTLHYPKALTNILEKILAQ